MEKNKLWINKILSSIKINWLILLHLEIKFLILKELDKKLNSEFQYFLINRKIFAASYLGDKIIDYEVYCFNSQPKFIRVHKPLFEKNHTILHNYYDLDWKLTDFDSGLKHYYRIPEIKIKKPYNLNLMLEYSKKLSVNFAFVRIDFYEINKKIYLSEITFSPSNCLMKFKNFDQSRYLGSLIDISKIRKI